MSKSFEISSVSPGRSYDYNASNGTRIRLRTDLKQTPKQNCTAAGLSWLNRVDSDPNSTSWLNSGLVQSEFGLVQLNQALAD